MIRVWGWGGGTAEAGVASALGGRKVVGAGGVGGAEGGKVGFVGGFAVGGRGRGGRV